MDIKFFENLKIDTWWKFILYLGVAIIFASFYFKIAFIESKHLCGIGIGMLLVGIAHWIAQKHFSEIKPANAYTGPAAVISWKEIIHTPITKILFLLGIIFILLFGLLIIKNLI